MTYATQANLIDRFDSEADLAHLTEASGETVTTATITKILDGAEGEVNSYLAAHLAVPVDVSTHAGAAELLSKLTLDIAVYSAHGLRPPIPEDVRARRNEAIEWLVRFAKGEVRLPAAAAPESTVQDEPVGAYAFARETSGPEDMV